MPYQMEENYSHCPAEKPWAVVNQQTGDLKGCHARRQDALAHLRALYANEPKSGVVFIDNLGGEHEDRSP